MKISKIKIALIIVCISLGASVALLEKYFSNQKIQSWDYLIAGISFVVAMLVASLVIFFISKKGYFMHYKSRGQAHEDTNN